MKEPLRKCKICDTERLAKSINLNTDKFIYYNNKYYHYDCFLKNIFENNKKGLSPEDIITYVDKKLLNTIESKSVRDSIDRDRLVYWIYENYNVTMLSNLFFTKLTNINKGKYSNNITVPISFYDLLQIFIKMKPRLDKINGKNEREGKHFSAQGRIDYDLAIVLNNYDDYVKWKQKQKAKNTQEKQLQEEIKSKSNIQTDNIVTVQRSRQNEDTELNISELLDELF